MSQETFYDPREDIPHDLKTGQVYRDSRTDDRSTLVFLNDEAALLRDDDGHYRLQKRDAFEENVGAGRLSLDGEADLDELTREREYDPDDEDTIDFDEVPGIGSAAAESLIQAGIHTKEDVEDGGDGLLDLDYIGQKNLSELREHVGLETGREEFNVDFENVPHIGSITADELRGRGYETNIDIEDATDDELLDVPGMGEKSLQKLREVVDGDS